MARRGRPTVLRSYSGDDKGMLADMRELVGDGSNRRNANHFYYFEAITAIMEAATEIKYYKTLVPDKGAGKIGVLEQLGRLLIQDGCDMNTFIMVADGAGEALHNGAKAKDVETTVRSFRKLVKE